MSDMIPTTEQPSTQEESPPEEIALHEFAKNNEALAEQIFSIFDEVVQNTCRTDQDQDQDQPIIWAVGIISSGYDPLLVHRQADWLNLIRQQVEYKSGLERNGLILPKDLPRSKKDPPAYDLRLNYSIIGRYGPVATSLHFDLEEKQKNIEKGQAPKTLAAVSGLGVNNIVIGAWFNFILELAKDNNVSEPMEDTKVGEIRDFIGEGIRKDISAIGAIREELYPDTTTGDLSNDQIAAIHTLVETSYLANTAPQEQN